MACEKRVDGQMMSYPCELPTGHESNGPEHDPEPCATTEVPASMRRHDQWKAREEARSLPPESVEDIAAEAEQTFAEEQVAEPEHNLRDGNCMMRPFDGPEVAPDSVEVCPVCSGAKRPQVLVENDAMIRAGEMHNPFSADCTKRVGGEMALAGERCYICQPEEAKVVPEEEVPTFLLDHSTPANIVDMPDFRQRFNEAIDRDSVLPRLSQQEAGYASLVGDPDFPSTRPQPIEPSLAVCQNPDCTATEVHGHNDGGWPLLPRPTKQREGDQVLPAGGDRPVQDWMIQREQERQSTMEGYDQTPRFESEFVVDAMEESKRVGIERYGQPLHTFDGRLNIRDLADELRDAFVYISKMQMTAEADKATLVRMVADALDGVQRSWNPAEMTTDRIAEVAVDRILDWVIVQRLGPEQVMPVRQPQADEEWMGT